MLGLFKLPFSTRARLLVGSRTLNSCFTSRLALLRREWKFSVQKFRGLSCTAGRDFKGREALNVARRYLSNRAAMVGNGKKMETPMVPSFIEIRSVLFDGYHTPFLRPYKRTDYSPLGEVVPAVPPWYNSFRTERL